jgi:hypothetical protein
MGGIGGDVGKQPVLAIDPVSNQDSVRRVRSKRDRNLFARETEFQTGYAVRDVSYDSRSPRRIGGRLTTTTRYDHHPSALCSLFQLHWPGMSSNYGSSLS